jgi:hypothetical protein
LVFYSQKKKKKKKKKKNCLLFVEAFLWIVEKSWSWGFDFIAWKEKIQSALVEKKKKKSVLFYLGYRAFAD